MENNGTYDMGGNLWEWIESSADGTLDNMTEERVIRGGAYSSALIGLSSSSRYKQDPAYSDTYNRYGFRVAAIPEPSAFSFMAVFGVGIVFIRRFFPVG
jgi:formylglycine-generating enzyme required for sulfatase activity